MLAPITLGERSAALAQEARRLAAVLESDLLFVHVADATPPSEAEVAGTIGGLESGGESLRVATGRADRVICRLAREVKADLIVAGALEREGLVGYYLGSVARSLARSAPCSVLLLPAPKVSAQPFRRPVAVVRFDEISRRMVAWAIRLGCRDRAVRLEVIGEYELTGLHMAQAEDSPFGQLDRYGARLRAEAELRVRDLLDGLSWKGLSVRTRALVGKEGWVGMEFARSHGADLVLFAAPPRRSFWARVFKRGDEFAMQSLPCAFLLYRPARSEPTGQVETSRGDR